jgi:hypothetical protein
MSEENKACMRRFYEDIFGSKNVNVLDQYLSSSFVDHNPALQASVDFQVAEGDIVVSRMTMSGTQTGTSQACQLRANRLPSRSWMPPALVRVRLLSTGATRTRWACCSNLA